MTSKSENLKALNLIGNMVVMATMAYTVILIIKNTPPNYAGKPAKK
jgi:hypothetical protein